MFNLDFTAFKTVPLFFAMVVLVAFIGKMIGAGGVAILLKVKPLESLAVGLTMNNRGAVELIIASIGLQMGIIDNNIFSILIMMAFATTMVGMLSMGALAPKLRE